MKPSSAPNRIGTLNTTFAKRRSLMGLPLDLIYEILSHLSLSDLARLQQTCSAFYNFILTDQQFTYFNTVKLFELYYHKRLFAVFLFPHIDPRYSYTGRNISGRTENTVCTSGNTAFHIAAANGLKDVISRFLVLEKTHQLRFMACNKTRYNEEAMQFVALNEANRNCRLVDLVNDEPNTALHYISVMPESVGENEVLGMAQLLIREGSNVWKRGRAGNTVLSEASQHGQVAMVRLILNESKRMLMTQIANRVQNRPTLDSLINRLSLHSSRELQPSKEEVRLLAETHLAAQIDLVNDYEENALILAARSHAKIVRLLLEHGANPNVTRHGCPLIHIVCSNFLLDRQQPSEFSAYHNHRTRAANTTQLPSLTDQDPLADEEEEGASQDQVLRYLLHYGADPHRAQDGTGMKPLHTAAFWYVQKK